VACTKTRNRRFHCQFSSGPMSRVNGCDLAQLNDFPAGVGHQHVAEPLECVRSSRSNRTSDRNPFAAGNGGGDIFRAQAGLDRRRSTSCRANRKCAIAERFSSMSGTACPACAMPPRRRRRDFPHDAARPRKPSAEGRPDCVAENLDAHLGADAGADHPDPVWIGRKETGNVTGHVGKFSTSSVTILSSVQTRSPWALV